MSPDTIRVSLEPISDDGEVFESTIAADVPDPEETAIAADLSERVQRTVAGLKPTYQTVARGLMAGLPRGKIMESIGATPQAFTWYRKALANALVREVA